jgi:putative heme-binding domain-containing protein
VAADLPQKGHEDFMQRAASVVASRKKDLEIAAVLREISSRFYSDPEGCIAALNGLGAGLRQGGRDRMKLPQSQPMLLALVDHAPEPVAKAALRVTAVLESSPSTQLASAVERARAVAVDPAAPPERREIAAAILGLDPSGKTVDVLAKLLTPAEPDAVQLAAASALNNLHSPEVAQVAIDHWRAATGKTRDILLAGFFNDQRRLPALLDAVKAGTVPAWAFGPARTRQLLQHNDPKIRQQAQALLSDPLSNRQPIYDKYVPALTMKGDADRGRKVWQRVCSECHQLANEGSDVGPDLRTVTKRYKETLLADILMPNQNIEAGYEEYLVETTDGQQITGILAKETPTTLTLRRKKGEQDTVLRSKVKSMRSLSVSPMPENLDESITVEQMSDLIVFIKSLK